MKTHSTILALLAIGLFGLASATAAVIITPDSVTASSSFSPATLMIDGSGFDTAGQAAIANGASVPSTWPTSQGLFDTNWVSNIDPVNLTVTFHFSSLSDVGSLHFWNYDGDVPGRSVQQFDIAFSADGTSWSAAQTFSGLPKESANNQGNAGITLALSQAQTGVQWARLTNIANYGDRFTGIEEVRFISSVPEPSTWAMMVAGLGALAGIRRLRRRSNGDCLGGTRNF